MRRLFRLGAVLTIAAAGTAPATMSPSVPAAANGGAYLSAWGLMANGVLGSGYPPCCRFRPFPVPAAGISHVVSIAAGSDHALAARVDGSVWAWGADPAGTLGFHAAGHVYRPQRVPGISGAVQVAAAKDASLALRRDGTVWEWGADAAGTIRPPGPVTGLTGIRFIAAGYGYHVAVSAGGSVLAWGRLNVPGMPLQSVPHLVPGLTGVTRVAVSENFALALTRDGKVYVWGATSIGCLVCSPRVVSTTPVAVRSAGGTPLTAVTGIAAGLTLAAFTVRGGGVLTWGVLPSSPPQVQRFPTRVPGIVDAVQVAAGSAAVYVRHAGGSLSAWGLNQTGQLGTGTRMATRCLCSPLPVPVVGIHDALDVVGGTQAAFALTETPVAPHRAPPARVCVTAVGSPPGGILLRGASLTALALDPTGKHLFVTAGGGYNSETGDPVCRAGLATVSAANGEVVRTAGVGPGNTLFNLRPLAVDPRTGTMVALDFGDQTAPEHAGSVRVFDGSGVPLGPVIPFRRPLDAVIDAGAGRAYISGYPGNNRRNVVTALDVHSGRIVQTIAQSISAIAMDYHTHRVFLVAGSRVTTLDAASGRTLSAVALSQPVHNITVDETSSRVFLSAFPLERPGADTLPPAVFMLDAESGALLRRIVLPLLPLTTGTLVADPADGLVLTAGGPHGLLLDDRSGDVLRPVTLPAPGISDPAAASPAGGAIVYAAGNSLLALDPGTGAARRLGAISPRGLAGLAIDGRTGRVYALEMQANDDDVRLACLTATC